MPYMTMTLPTNVNGGVNLIGWWPFGGVSDICIANSSYTTGEGIDRCNQDGDGVTGWKFIQNEGGVVVNTRIILNRISSVYELFDNSVNLDADGEPVYSGETDIVYLIGQGLGLFNTGDGWSGNLNNVQSSSGYWLNINRTHTIHFRRNVGAFAEDLVASSEPVYISGAQGYENNLFTFIPPDDTDHDINYLNDHFMGSCDSTELTNIPNNTVLYHSSADAKFFSTWDSDTQSWINIGDSNILTPFKPYNIQLPSDTSGCFVWDENDAESDTSSES